MLLDAKTDPFWQSYLASLPNAEKAKTRFYEVFQIGDGPKSADAGADLIKRGVKTTTSGLLWDYQATGLLLPYAGCLSVVADGQGDPVCVVETIAVEIKGFSDVDAAFAYNYGEWDRTLETWRTKNWEFYTPECLALGKEPSPEMLLVCEWFKVVYP